jgi:hypothetical protein
VEDLICIIVSLMDAISFSSEGTLLNSSLYEAAKILAMSCGSFMLLTKLAVQRPCPLIFLISSRSLVCYCVMLSSMFLPSTLLQTLSGRDDQLISFQIET